MRKHSHAWLKAFTISIAIYLLIILLYFRVELPQKEEEVYKPFNLKLVPPSPQKKLLPTPTPKPPQKKVLKPKPKAKKPIIKQRQKPKTAKKPVAIKEHTNEQNSTITLTPPKLPFKMPSLSQLNTIFTPTKVEPNKKVMQLYGKAAANLSKEQVEYLNKYLITIANITQSYLNQRGGAFLGSQLNLKGTLHVEFMLHPNGDMSDYKILKSSSFHVLDSDFQEVIEIVYKDYPYPTKKTPVRFQMSYL